MNGIELNNIPCITPERLIKRAFKYCFYYTGCRTKLINELSKFDCAHARYWIEAIKQIA
jgi:hypothetical protein